MCPENSHFHPKFPKTKAFATKILQVSGGHSLACTSPPHQSDGHQSLHPGPPNDKGYQGLRPDPPLPPLSPSSSSLPLDQSKQINPSTVSKAVSKAAVESRPPPSLVGAHLLSAPLLACRLAKGGGTSILVPFNPLPPSDIAFYPLSPLPSHSDDSSKLPLESFQCSLFLSLVCPGSFRVHRSLSLKSSHPLSHCDDGCNGV